jgi:hypothetical protein
MVNHMAAVRAFNRVWRPISDRLEMAADADAGFDAGEFSGKFHGDLMGREFFRCLDLVATRFGITGNQLWYATEAASQENFYRAMEAEGEA